MSSGEDDVDTEPCEDTSDIEQSTLGEGMESDVIQAIPSLHTGWSHTPDICAENRFFVGKAQGPTASPPEGQDENVLWWFSTQWTPVIS